jgi:hypothetical protein
MKENSSQRKASVPISMLESLSPALRVIQCCPQGSSFRGASSGEINRNFLFFIKGPAFVDWPFTTIFLAVP